MYSLPSRSQTRAALAAVDVDRVLAPGAEVRVGAAGQRLARAVVHLELPRAGERRGGAGGGLGSHDASMVSTPGAWRPAPAGTCTALGAPSTPLGRTACALRAMQRVAAILPQPSRRASTRISSAQRRVPLRNIARVEPDHGRDPRYRCRGLMTLDTTPSTAARRRLLLVDDRRSGASPPARPRPPRRGRRDHRRRASPGCGRRSRCSTPTRRCASPCSRRSEWAGAPAGATAGSARRP